MGGLSALGDGVQRALVFDVRRRSSEVKCEGKWWDICWGLEEMEYGGVRRNGGAKVVVGMPDEALVCVLKYVDAPQDRAAVSLVCQQWRRVDGATRKAVTIANMYATSPAACTRRFKGLAGLKLKGKPRASEYSLVQSNWGGYAEPWLRELGGHYEKLKSLVLRRVTVLDSGLALIASATFSHALQVLHLHKCVGFTTKGLLLIARSCG